MKKISVCFGGYCPMHQGHLDVIMKAKKENDSCILVVCGYDNETRADEINLSLGKRYEIISEFFKDDEQINVISINDTELGLDESMSLNNWKIWTTEVKRKITEIEDNSEFELTFYVAESYYKTCLNTIGFDVVLCDKVNAVSGTAIRKTPVKYWNKIAEPFKKYLVKNILIVGTASEGKSTLCKDLQRYFNCPISKEYGRSYMEWQGIKSDTELVEEDFINFIGGQEASNWLASNAAANYGGICICDTDNAVTLMYADAYADDPDCPNITKEVFANILDIAKNTDQLKWDAIFCLTPNNTFVDDGSRYMKQSSMLERQKNLIRLQHYLKMLYPNNKITYLKGGEFLKNFETIKNYINSL